MTTAPDYAVASSSSVFANYEKVRNRLPSALTTRTTRQAGNLAEIADGFDLFLLDAFGVLNIGESVIPGVPERLQSLRAAGKMLRVVTNAASVPKSALVEKYQRLGYDFADYEVISSREVALSALP